MSGRPVACLLVAATVLSAAAPAPVTLVVDPQASGPAIPADFLGLSFEAANLLPEPDGAHLFSAANQPLVAAFRALGVRSLRIGGAMADRPGVAVPSERDIDHLFAFAAAADLQVIYTLRLPRARPEDDAALARYIRQHYAARLTCFEIGNEPDFYRRVYREIPDYPAYRALWKPIADAVAAAAPGAKFCGPAAGGVTAFSRSFAEDFAGTGMLAALVQHEYPGGDGNLLSDAPARDALLSRGWMELYDRLYQSFAAAAVAHGLPYRLEETNNFTGGAKNATDTFAASLWALDYLHWWAAHGASGINFHNRRWILNTTIYPVNPADDGLKSGYRLHPIACGIKAFALGGHGTAIPVRIAHNPDALNITAYAVRDGAALFVTIINKKDPGVDAIDAQVTVDARGAAPVSVLFLTAPDNDVAAKEGIALGGAPVGEGWSGHWTPLASGENRAASIRLPGPSAAVIQFSLERSRP